MTVEEIVSLIGKDIENAFNELDRIFSDKDSSYGDLMDIYINRPNNFTMSDFRSRLIRLVKYKKTEIEDFYKNIVCFNHEHEKKDIDRYQKFQQLCNLDFKVQEQKFKSLIQDRSFGLFIIRGENECGQRWLLQQLMEPYQSLIEHTLCFEDFNLIFESMKSVLNIDTNARIEQKYDDMVDYFAQQHERKHQFIIFKKAYSFVHSSEFEGFYKEFLDRLHRKVLKMEKKGIKNKTIILFVEETSAPYAIEMYRDKCMFFEDDDIISHANHIETWQTKKDFLYLIGLEPIKKISCSEFNKWVRGTTHVELLKKFHCEDVMNQFLSECENGNPYQIIIKVAPILEYDIKWKY